MGDYPLGYQRGFDERLGSPLSFFRGTETGLRSLTEIQDGRLLFATDSKKIYLDCDFVTGEGTPVQKRIPFGGSTAVLYGAKQFSDADIEQGNFAFGLDDIENIEELPDLDSLVLNTLDGSFYRITGLSDDGTEVIAERLSVSGSGGSGSGSGAGYIVGKIVNGATKFFTKNEATFPIQYSAMSSIEGAIMYAKVYINNTLVANIDPSEITQSMTEVNTINLKPYIDTLGTSFLINDVNKVSLVLTDDYDNTKTLKYDITVFDLYVVPSQASLPIQTGNFLYQCRPYGGRGLQNRTLTFELRNVGEENVIWDHSMSLANQQDGSTINLTIPFQTHGTYNLSIYISGTIPQTGGYIKSEPLVQQVMFYESGQSAPLISIAALDKYLYNQYDNILVNYMVAYDATTHSKVILVIEIDEGSGRQVVSSIPVTVENNKTQTWNISFDKAGYYFLTVKIQESEYVQVSPMITVQEFKGGDVPEIDEEQSALQLYLSAQGRSNDESDRDSWTYSYGNETIECDFEGFNWQSNGWQTDANGITSLHLDNGAKLTIPFSPFPSNGDTTTFGKTIEIDFKISNVRGTDSELITCYSTNAAGDPSSDAVVGFVITENQSALNSSGLKTIGKTASTAAKSEKGLIATFKEDKRMHITYAINSKSDNPARMVYTYINGAISGLVRYSENDSFADATKRDSKFIFTSDNADVDIYNIRVYAQSLSGREILWNYIADQNDPKEKVSEWKDNDVLDSEGTDVFLTKVELAENIPYMVFEDGRKCDKKGVITAGATTGGLPTGKKDYRYCTVHYVDPEHPGKNFPESGSLPMLVYGQGTSSMSYPVKNLRIKFLDDTVYGLRNGENGDITPVNLFCLKADYMESSSAHNTGTGNVLFELYDSIGLYTPAQLTYGLREHLTAIVGHPIICFFKPYGSDSYEYIGRYNFNLDKATPEPFGFFESEEEHYGVRLESYPEWNSSYKTAVLDINTRGGFDHTLDSKPAEGKTYYTAPDLEAVWTGTKEQFESYLKSTGCLYEYSENAARSIQCWEFLDNGQALCGMRAPWDETADAQEKDAKNEPYPTWRSSFECRYPEPETKVCTDKRAMARVINWLVSTNQNLATDQELPEEEWLTVNDNGATIVYKIDTREYRLLKFKQQFYDYFRMDYTAFYYVLTEVLCMMDSRAKNMMFCTFDADPDRGTGHWFPIFYDMDTMLGVNNSGVLEFDYNVEDYGTANPVYNGSSDYNHNTYSVLWCNFRQAFMTEIRDMYNSLRAAGKLSYSNLIQLYNNAQADKWNLTYINEDAEYKYIRPLTEKWWDDNYIDPETQKQGGWVGGEDGGIDYLYIAQGTRSDHREYWLYNRFKYLDSKYEYSRSLGLNPDVDFRTNTPSGVVTENQTDAQEAERYAKSLAVVPSDLSFQLTSLVDQYALMKYSQTETEPVKVYAGETVTINPPPNLSANDTETFIQDATEYSDYGNLANKYVSKFVFNKAVKIRRLKLGDAHPDYYNPKLDSLGTSFSSVVPFLEELDVQHCHKLSGILDLQKCSYLQTVKAAGTSYTNISLPVGGNLKYLSLPATTNTLKVHNHLYFDTKTNPENLTLESYEKLSSLWIQDCPLVDTKAIVNASPHLRNVRLMDINWEFNLNECVIETDDAGKQLITGVKLLDKLIYIPEIKDTETEQEEEDGKVIHGLDANGNNIERAEIGNQYLAGTITIKNGSVGISDMDFYQKYNKYFPNLKFKYDANENNKQAYTINICDAQKQTQYRYLTKITADAQAVATFNTNLESWFANPALTPVLKKTPSVKYKYEFLGWNTVAPKDFEEANVAQADSILAFKVVENSDGTRTVTRMNNFALTTEDFQNMEFSFYPTYAAVIQEYTVTFYRDDTHTDILKREKVKYGNDATPPPDPFILRLPETENTDGSPDDNVTKCYCRPFTKYSIGYTGVVGNVDTHAEYGEEVEFKTLPSDVSYFTIDKYSMANGTWKLVLKEGFQEEAIVIPSVVEGNDIGGIAISRVNAPRLRRIYFAPSSKITEFDMNFYVDPGITSSMTEAEKLEAQTRADEQNAILEYIDFVGLASLEAINLEAFKGQSKLYVPDILPHSLRKIGNGAFNDTVHVRISCLPQALEELGQMAFQNCAGIREINLNDSIPIGLQQLPTRAFANCENLTLTGNNIGGIESSQLTTIGERAFQNCFALGIDFNEYSSVKNIVTRAFSGCYNAQLLALPWDLETIGNYAFDTSGNTNTIYLSAIPPMVTSIGNNAFGSRVISDGRLIMLCASATDIHKTAFNGLTVNTIILPEGVDRSAAPWANAPWGATKADGSPADVIRGEDAHG